MPDPILTVRKLDVSYGAVDAVRDVGFSLERGKIVSLVGPNGAGKSSTLNAIMGLVPATGEILLRGESVLGLATEAIVRRRMTLCPEGRRVFAELTVEENLVAGAVTLSGRGVRAEKTAMVFELFPVLGDRRRQAAGTLSGGEQQMLAIGRALMSGPELLLLDEPSLGLAPQIVEQMFVLIDRLRRSGYTILLVEQNVEQALEISDFGYVMVNGEIRIAAAARELMGDAAMRNAYFGVG